MMTIVFIFQDSKMLEDKLPEIVRLTHNIKILVSASYKAKQSLAAKGLTPAIFLDPFYSQKSQNSQQVSFNFKQKQIKPLPEYLTVDLDDYMLIRKEDRNTMEDLDEDLLGRKMCEMLAEERLKYIRDVDKSIFSDRGSIEKFINNQGYHWFQKSTKMYFHALTMGQDNYRVNTSDQPLGVCYVIQVEKQKSVKQIFEKVKSESDYLLKKLYELTSDQFSNIKPVVIILFDVSKGNSVQQALQYSTYLNNNANIHKSLIYRLAINGEDVVDLIVWSRFVRPVLHCKYDIKGSDPIRIMGEEGFTKIQEVVNHHKETIRRAFQMRLDDLIKRHEDVNKTTKLIANFFKGNNTPSQKTYNKQQVDQRELADKLFMIEDYKRAYDIYRSLVSKMEKRNPMIENNLSEMIQLCLTMSKFHNTKIKSDPYNEIEKYADKIFKYYETKGKLRLKKYLLFLIYTFHTFRTFDRQFIRSVFYPQVKKTFSNNTNTNVISVLLYQQFANANLFYKNVDYRRYSYDMTRVASRFSEIKMYAYALRCFLLVQALYNDTFSNIEKYQFTQLSHLFIEARNIKESLKNLKSSWEVYIDRMETEDTQKNQQQLPKLIENYNKMLREIQKMAPLALSEPMEPNLRIPVIHSLNLQIKDQMLEFDEKSGTKWQDIGESILESKELMSSGLNQRQFRNLFKSFDQAKPEEKYLIYKFNSGVMTEAVLKKNSRTMYVGEPIKLSFYMRNPIRGDIDVQDIKVKLKQNMQQVAIQNNNSEVSIKGFQSAQVNIILTPKEPGFLEVQRIEWIFMKLFTYFDIKEPSQIKSNAKSCYFKLNVLPPVGCLECKAFFQDYYYEGQKTRMRLYFKNIGVEKIDKIYIAPGQEDMFGFKLKQLNFQIAPNSQKQVHYDIFVPLVHDTIQSGQQKRINKILILYKTGDRFRISRTINKFNILRIAKIQNIVCERLSTYLHLLSFSRKKQPNVKEADTGLQWMIIPPGFDIVKKEAADLASQTNYFFFIRKGNFGMAKFQFENWAKEISSYPEDFFNLSNPQNSLSIRFFWRKNQKIGYISKQKIPVNINEHGYLSTIFPISFKINYQKELSHNFRENPFLQIPISIKLKNVLCNDELKVTVNFIDGISSDSSWQGITQRKLNLKMSSQAIIDVKYVVVKPGIYLLSNEIKYSIVNSKAQFVNIVHSEYEKIYLTVKDQVQDKKIDFQEAFKDFGAQDTKTIEIKIDPNDSLI